MRRLNTAHKNAQKYYIFSDYQTKSAKNQQQRQIRSILGGYWGLLGGIIIQCSHNKKRHTKSVCAVFLLKPKAVLSDGIQRSTASVAFARMKFDYFGWRYLRTSSKNQCIQRYVRYVNFRLKICLSHNCIPFLFHLSGYLTIWPAAL